MASKVHRVSFTCPVDLVQRLDDLAGYFEVSRDALLHAAALEFQGLDPVRQQGRINEAHRAHSRAITAAAAPA